MFASLWEMPRSWMTNISISEKHAHALVHFTFYNEKQNSFPQHAEGGDTLKRQTEPAASFVTWPAPSINADKDRRFRPTAVNHPEPLWHHNEGWLM